MAARAVVPDGSQADQFNWFCDQHRAALDFSQIGRVRQVVKNGELRSVFEVKAGLSPLAFGLPVSVYSLREGEEGKARKLKWDDRRSHRHQPTKQNK